MISPRHLYHVRAQFFIHESFHVSYIWATRYTNLHGIGSWPMSQSCHKISACISQASQSCHKISACTSQVSQSCHIYITLLCMPHVTDCLMASRATRVAGTDLFRILLIIRGSIPQSTFVILNDAGRSWVLPQWKMTVPESTLSDNFIG